MGTNFYLMSHRDEDHPDFHIGKRSAAGLYCWDCNVTLCKDGEYGIHKSTSNFFSKCPKCGKSFDGKSLEEGSVAVELGFAQPYEKKERKGVKPVSSFTWAMLPEKLKRKRKVVDEYGRVYTKKQFQEIVLDNCPITFFESIGKWFS